MSNAGIEAEFAGKLHIHIEPAEAGGRISLYHVGQSLAITQRIINREVEDDDGTIPQLNLLSKEERREAFQLSFQEISFGSIDLTAIINYTYINGLLPFFRDATTQIFAAVVAGIILKVTHINEGENPFKPDDPIRPGLEDLVTTADAGKLIFALRFGPFSCSIGHKTAERLKEINRAEHLGTEASEMGTVVGSSMEDHSIQIYLEHYDKKIPCYYSEHESRDFERFTQLRTKVIITGIPVWKGVKEAAGPPHFFRLRLIQKYSAQASSSHQP